MPRVLIAFPVWLSAAWCMSLTLLGLMVVPMLFAFLPSPALAGNMAAKLFGVQTWVSVASALGLLLCLRNPDLASKVAAGRVPKLMVWILAGMLLALLVEFAVSPRILARENLRLWHSLGSLMYVTQWVCSALVFWGLTVPKEAAPD